MIKFTKAEMEYLRYQRWLATHQPWRTWDGRLVSDQPHPGCSVMRVAILRPYKNGEVAYLEAAWHNKHGIKPYPVAYWRSDRPTEVRARDIDFSGMAGWTVRWGAAMKRTHYSYYMGASDPWEWRKEDDVYDWKNWAQNLMLWSPVLNSEVLASTRYKYCGWQNNGRVHFPQFIRLYQQEPKVELLAKAGMWQLCSPGKVKTLAKDKRVMRFISQNPNACEVAWPFVRWAATHGKTLGDAIQREREKQDLNNYWSWCRYYWTRSPEIKKVFDKKIARVYCEKNGIDPGRYVEYLRLTHWLRPQLDLHARTNLYPTDFKKAHAIVKRMETIQHKKEEAERRRREEEWRRQHAAEIRARREAEAKRRKEEAEFIRHRDEHIKKFVAELKRALAKADTGDYKILWLEKQADFRKEGNRMGNCIGGGNYSFRMGKRQCVCLVLASKGERVDVEIGNDWRVRQCYTNKNARPSDAAAKIADSIAAALKKHYTSRRKAA